MKVEKTAPVTYRVSPEVDAAIRKLAKQHGGVDRALRVKLGLPERRSGK